MLKKKPKLAKELSDMVIYCKSVHFNGFEDARQNLSFYEMASFKEGEAEKLVKESGEEEFEVLKIYLTSVFDPLTHCSLCVFCSKCLHPA